MNADSRIDTGVANPTMGTQSAKSLHRDSALSAARAKVERACESSPALIEGVASMAKDATRAATDFRIETSLLKASSRMAKKRPRSRGNPIPRLLGLAFAAAKEADEARAREFLRQAESLGWKPNADTERRLQFTLRDARRDLGIKDVKGVDTGTESGTE